MTRRAAYNYQLIPLPYSILSAFFDVIRPPKLLQFVDDVIPILHGERTHSRRSVACPLPFASHHDGHGDVVVGTIDICVPKPVTQVERLTFSTFLQIIANLGGTLHIQDERLLLIPFNQLGEDLLAIAFASQFLTDSKVPEPVE